MKKSLGLFTGLALLILFTPVNSPNNLLTKGQIGTGISTTAEPVEPIPTLNDDVQAFLESKNSPLAPHTDFLLTKEHWKLLIAISAIESQYCTRKLGNNCWGIGGDSAYKHYSSIEEAITDADALISRWQKKGRWLTVEDMNCHYVQPCNPNWVAVVHKILNQMESYERDRRILE